MLKKLHSRADASPPTTTKDNKLTAFGKVCFTLKISKIVPC